MKPDSRVDNLLGEVAANLGVSVADYTAAYLSYAAEISATGALPADTVMVDHTLVSVRARDAGGVRTFLGDEYRALERLGGVGTLMSAVCGPSMPEPGDVSRQGFGAQVHVVAIGERRHKVDVTLRGGFYDDVLGGEVLPTELSRTFSLEVSHATWRDRPVRRLVALNVVAHVAVRGVNGAAAATARRRRAA